MKKERFLVKFENTVKETIKKYGLLSKNESVVVAMSGGKDSTTVAYLLEKFGYEVKAFHIDLGLGKYSEKCFHAVKQFCQDYGIKLRVYKMVEHFGARMCYIRLGVQSKLRLNNCAVCGIVKKWVINREARKMKADKLATGHNLDDEAETALINFFKGSPMLSLTSGPLVGIIRDKKFVPRIKPLYFVTNKETTRYTKMLKLPVVYEKCPCLLESYRLEARKFLSGMSKEKKLNIVMNNLKLIEKMRNKLSDRIEKLRYCKKCGEPSRREICKACELLGIAFPHAKP